MVVAYYTLNGKVPFYELGVDYSDRLSVSYFEYHQAIWKPASRVLGTLPNYCLMEIFPEYELEEITNES